MKVLLVICIICFILSYTEGHFTIGNKWFTYNWNARRYWRNTYKLFTWIKEKFKMKGD